MLLYVQHCPFAGLDGFCKTAQHMPFFGHCPFVQPDNDFSGIGYQKSLPQEIKTVLCLEDTAFIGHNKDFFSQPCIGYSSAYFHDLPIVGKHQNIVVISFHIPTKLFQLMIEVV